MVAECGDDSCGSWGPDYCSSGQLFKDRTCHDLGCASAACFDSTSTETEGVDDCAGNASDTDAQDIYTVGTCTEDSGCTAGSSVCDTATHTDSCLDADTVSEYYVSGDACTKVNLDCAGNEICQGGKCVAVDCTAGDCCDLDDYTFRDSDFVCDSWEEERCSGSECGDNVLQCSVQQYCPGDGADCSGLVDDVACTVSSDCAETQICHFDDDSGTFSCLDDPVKCGETACTADSECDDSNPCTADDCINPGTLGAYCDNPPVDDGTPCDGDDTVCTDDICISGACTHPPIPNDCGDRECGLSPSKCFDCGECDPGECIAGICVVGPEREPDLEITYFSASPLNFVKGQTAEFSAIDVTVKNKGGPIDTGSGIELKLFIRNPFTGLDVAGIAQPVAHSAGPPLDSGEQWAFPTVSDVDISDLPAGTYNLIAEVYVKGETDYAHSSARSFSIGKPVAVPELSALLVLMVAFSVLAILFLSGVKARG